MRLVLALACSTVACSTQPAAAPKPDPSGTCYDGQIVGAKVSACAEGKACVLAPEGPACVAASSAEQKEPCGTISCGIGCACSGDTPNECVCMELGPKPK